MSQPGGVPGLPAVIPEKFSETYFLATVYAGARINGLASPAQAFYLIQRGESFGLAPADAVEVLAVDPRTFKVVVPARVLLAEFRRRGGDVEVVEHTDDLCRLRFVPKDGTPQVHEWSKADDARAGLVGRETHSRYPRQLLYWRAIGHGIRAVDPAATHGCYSQEEMGTNHEEAHGGPESMKGLAGAVERARAALPAPVGPAVGMSPALPASTSEKAPGSPGEGAIAPPEAQGANPPAAHPQIASQVPPAAPGRKCNLDHIRGVAEAACQDEDIPPAVLERKWAEFEGRENGEALANAWIDAITPAKERHPRLEPDNAIPLAGASESVEQRLHGWIRSVSKKIGKDGHESAHWIGGLLKPKDKEGIPEAAIHPKYGSCPWELRIPSEDEPPAWLSETAKGVEVALIGPGWTEWAAGKWEFKATDIVFISPSDRHAILNK